MVDLGFEEEVGQGSGQDDGGPLPCACVPPNCLTSHCVSLRGCAVFAT